MLRRAILSSFCGLLLVLCGCPKRQGQQSEIVYVPAPKPAPAQVAASSPPETKPQVLVIEEPPPPAPPAEAEPEEEPPPQTPEPTAHHRTRHPAHPEATADQQDETPAAETPETPAPAVPALEPRQSSAEESELRREILGLQQDIGKRLERLAGAHLSGNDQKALEDARTFFTQANQAMADGDLPRALNLAHKASLLLSALE
jgi:hypothetical protein